MKPKQAETLGDVIDQYLAAIGADKKLVEVRLRKKWHEIVGVFIAKDTQIILLEKGVLKLKFKTPIIRKEISLQKTILIERINKIFGDETVKSIEILL